MDMHTKAQLTVHSGSLWADSPVVFLKGEENGIPIARMDREPDNGTVPVERDANAHRLAACWNICQGISTEVLAEATEAGVTLDVLVERLKKMAESYGELSITFCTKTDLELPEAGQDAEEYAVDAVLRLKPDAYD